MTLREYRMFKRITQDELAEELKGVCPGIDRPLIAKIESGIVRPSQEVMSYIEDHCAQCLIAPTSHENIFVDKSIDRAKKDAEIGDFLTDKEMLVIEALNSATKESPVTRSKLRELTNLKDNMARELIGRLRDKGYRIIGTAAAKGYWIAKTPDEYKSFREEYRAKGMTYLRRIKAMDLFTEGQVILSERGIYPAE